MRRGVRGRLVRDRIIWDGECSDPIHELLLIDRRYLLITLGALTLAFAFIRIVVFKMPESPRYLLSKGRDAEAVDAVNFVARRNGKAEPLTLDMLQDIDVQLGLAVDYEEEGRGLSRVEVMKDNFKDFKGVEYSKLFANKKLGLHTGLIWLIWLTIGMGLLTHEIDLADTPRHRVPSLLQLPSLIPRTEVHREVIPLPHIQKLLHRVFRRSSWSNRRSLHGQYATWSSLDDGRIRHCDGHFPVRLRGCRHAHCRLGFLVCDWLAWELWYVFTSSGRL